MKKVILVLLVSSNLAACGYSTQVQKPTTSKYGPANQVATGIVKYRSDANADANREHAFHSMYRICKGEYEIVTETAKNEGGVAIPVGGMYVAKAIVWTYVEYKCL